MFRLMALVGLFAVVQTAVFSEEIEIVVTASRVEEDARSTPSYVRVIPEEDIQKGNTVLDALRSLSDIAIRSSSPGNEYVAMGGFGENGFGRTLILIDGRPVNRADMASVNWRAIPLDRIERIEVVKGPMSSLYGDQAVAGTINIITKEPEGFEYWGRADLTTNLTNLTNRQTVGASFAGETFRAEASFHREDLKPSRKRSSSHTIVTNLNLGMTMGNFDVDVGGLFSISQYQLPGGLSEAEYKDNPDQAKNKEDEVSQITLETKLNPTIRIGTITLALPFSWRRVDSTSNMTSWSSFNNPVLDDFRATLKADTTFFIDDMVALTPVGGIDANWSKIAVKSYNTKQRKVLKNNQSANRYDIAVWLRTKALFGEHWVADVGMRFSMYEITGGDKKVRYTPFVYDIGASWLPVDQWTVSFRYGRVFRYPLLDEQASYYFGPSVLNTSLRPEIGHHVTASLEFRDRQFSASLAPYFIAMADEIAFNPVAKKNENIGETYHFGAVLSGSWSNAIFGIETSYSFDGARFKTSEKVVPLVPEHTIYSRFSYTPIKSLEFSTDARITSVYYKGGDNTNSQSMVNGRTDWNVQINWYPIEGLTVYGKVVNLLDHRTPTAVYWNSFSGDSWYPVDGRQFDFGVNWQH